MSNKTNPTRPDARKSGAFGKPDDVNQAELELQRAKAVQQTTPIAPATREAIKASNEVKAESSESSDRVPKEYAGRKVHEDFRRLGLKVYTVDGNDHMIEMPSGNKTLPIRWQNLMGEFAMAGMNHTTGGFYLTYAPAKVQELIASKAKAPRAKGTRNPAINILETVQAVRKGTTDVIATVMWEPYGKTGFLTIDGINHAIVVTTAGEAFPEVKDLKNPAREAYTANLRVKGEGDKIESVTVRGYWIRGLVATAAQYAGRVTK